jgi:flagellar basal body P-ring formation protein FlgA
MHSADAQSAAREWPVPRNTLYPGQIIDAGGLSRRSFLVDEAVPAGVHQSDTTLIGKVARRTLMAGQPIPQGAVKDPDIIIQGRPYSLVYRSEGLVITGIGIPLQSGGVGDMIAVRNPDTGLIVKGRVLPDRTLAVEGS